MYDEQNTLDCLFFVLDSIKHTQVELFQMRALSCLRGVVIQQGFLLLNFALYPGWLFG